MTVIDFVLCLIASLLAALFGLTWADGLVAWGWALPFALAVGTAAWMAFTYLAMLFICGDCTTDERDSDKPFVMVHHLWTAKPDDCTIHVSESEKSHEPEYR